MKTLLTLLLLLLTTLLSFGTTCTTISDGIWSGNPSDIIWDCVDIFAADTIILNHNIIINNPNLVLGDSITLLVNDTLIFDGGKLKLGYNSTIKLATDGYIRSIDNGNNSKIDIGTTNIWSSNNDPLCCGVIIPTFMFLFPVDGDGDIYRDESDTTSLPEIVKIFSMDGTMVNTIKPYHFYIILYKTEEKMWYEKTILQSK